MGNPVNGKLAMAMTALLLCVGLSACNERSATKTKTVTIEKPCNCTRETAIEDDYYPEPPRYVRHHAKKKTYRRHYAERPYAPRKRHVTRSYYSDEFYAGGYYGESAEIQSRSYSRSSSSQTHRYYKNEELVPMDRDARYSRYDSRSEMRGRWVDGYGRVHYASSGVQSGPMVINSRQGRATWHGYGVYCSDADHRHGEWDNYGYEHRDHSKVGHHFD